MEILIKESEIVLSNLQDSQINTTINKDSIITVLKVEDSKIDVTYAASSIIERSS